MTQVHHATCESFWVSTVLIFVGLAYFLGWLRVRERYEGSVAGWRVSSFLLGLLLIWIAMASPLAALDHELLTAHMVQHLLLMTIAPPLILLGVPRKMLEHSPLRRFLTLGSLFQSTPTQQPRSALLQPALCWLAAAATLVVWHIPWVFIQGLRSETWHGIEQASFLASGLLFWWHVVGPTTRTSKPQEWSMLLYLFLATLPCDILSGFLVFCDRVVYPVFLSSRQSFGFSAMEDQQCAGALMWTCVTLVYLIAATIYAARLLAPHRTGERSIPQIESQRIAGLHPDSQRIEVF